MILIISEGGSLSILLNPIHKGRLQIIKEMAT